MTEKEIIEHLKHMHDGIDELPYECEMNRDIEAVQEVLQLLEQKDNKINEAIECIKDNLNYVDELPVQEQLLGILEE